MRRFLITCMAVLGSGLALGATADAAYPPAPCTNKTITITGARTVIGGKPGVKVTGNSTCLSGQTVVPYLRFPGGEYFEGTARPNIETSGDFEFFRKTGRKLYLYFKVGDVVSNSIVIPAL